MSVKVAVGSWAQVCFMMKYFGD